MRLKRWLFAEPGVLQNEPEQQVRDQTIYGCLQQREIQDT